MFLNLDPYLAITLSIWCKQADRRLDGLSASVASIEDLVGFFQECSNAIASYSDLCLRAGSWYQFQSVRSIRLQKWGKNLRSIFLAASDRSVILRTRVCCSFISFCFLTKTTSLALFTSFHNPILTRSNSGRKTKDEAMILKRGQHLGFLADASSIDRSLGILGSSSFDYAGLEQMLAKSSILCFQNRRCEAVAFDCYNNLRFVSVSFHERCENMCLPGVIEEIFSFLLEPAGGSGFSEDFHGILGSFCGQPWNH